MVVGIVYVLVADDERTVVFEIFYAAAAKILVTIFEVGTAMYMWAYIIYCIKCSVSSAITITIICIYFHQCYFY